MPPAPGMPWMLRERDIPPIPLMDDAGWLPSDEQLGMPSSSKLGNRAKYDFGHRASSKARYECRASSCDGKIATSSYDGKVAASRELPSGLSSLLQQHCKELGDLVDARLAARNEELLRHLWQPPRVGAAYVVSEEPRAAPEKEDQRHWSFEQTEQMKLNRSRSFHTTRSHEGRKKRSFPSVHREMSWKTLRHNFWELLMGVVHSHYFEATVCAMIITNVLFLGFEVQTLRGVPEEDMPLGYQLVEYGYTIWFSGELVLRLLAAGCRRFFCDGETWAWNYVDFGLVLLSWFGTFFTFLIEVSPNFHYVRILRMARTTRILRVVRIVKFFRPLRILVYSVMNTVRSLFWTLVLLMILIYLVGVLFTMATWEYPSQARNASLDSHFGSLWSSVASLFMSITGGIDWQNCTVALGTLHPFWTMLFVIYIAFAHFAVLNVVTGVVCQTAIESARQDQDIVVHSQLLLKQTYIKQFEELFRKFDCDEVGQITLQDFESRLQDANLHDFFDGMDLSVDEAWNLFKLLDHRETCTIDVEEFVSGCLRLRGPARSLDVHMLIYQSKWTMKQLSQLMRCVEELRACLERPGWAGSRRFAKEEP